jgi:hypothetical protein
MNSADMSHLCNKGGKMVPAFPKLKTYHSLASKIITNEHIFMKCEGEISIHTAVEHLKQ